MKKAVLSTLVALAVGCAMITPAQAVEVAGAKIEDVAKVGGKDLVLNGAGLRKKMVFKVYAVGVYLTEKKTKAADVLAAPGPKRFKLVMLRELTGAEVGETFMAAVDKNISPAERTKLGPDLQKFNTAFKGLPKFKSGDVVLGDYVPGVGTVVTVNGKQAVEAVPEPQFFSALLRIWLGDSPASESLKEELLGQE